MVKKISAKQETWVPSVGWEDTLEKETPTHSSILAWQIPWTEKPGELQSMGSQKSQILVTEHACMQDSTSFDINTANMLSRLPCYTGILKPQTNGLQVNPPQVGANRSKLYLVFQDR